MNSYDLELEARYLQKQLNRSMNRLYQRFLRGDVDPTEFSEHLDELISFYVLEDVNENDLYCNSLV